jgi:DNA-binding MarR family transcriptional regulator
MQTDYSSLTPEEKKLDLFLRQKRTLDLFLERGAISKAQYDKSLGDLIEKMQIDQSIV